MNEEVYLIDNNVLSHMSQLQRSGRFFRERCRLPAEVLHEASGYPDAMVLKQVEYPTSARLLRILSTIMATMLEADTTLVNLYANKGAADPFLIACALHATEEAAALLRKPTWVVVSNDKAVGAKAAEFSVTTYTREEFFSRTQPSWDQ